MQSARKPFGTLYIIILEKNVLSLLLLLLQDAMGNPRNRFPQRPAADD